MIICKTIDSLHSVLFPAGQPKVSIGFVPTMGALHQGHLSLIGLSKQADTLTVCSIFVNPTQFNDPKDFEKYPVTIEQDILLLERAGCHVLFLPTVQEMYPNGTAPSLHYDLGYLETLLEGSHRPGHFQGVCQVVHRLLDIVQPTHFYLGQKDYQQCMVLKKLIELIGSPAVLTIGPTLREASGLAMSSRNMRLSEGDKQKATAIYEAHCFIKQHIQQGALLPLLQLAQKKILEAGFEKIDYVAIGNAATLQPVTNWDGKEQLVVLTAAFLNGVRLIDNMLLN